MRERVLVIRLTSGKEIRTGNVLQQDNFRHAFTNYDQDNALLRMDIGGEMVVFAHVEETWFEVGGVRVPQDKHPLEPGQYGHRGIKNRAGHPWKRSYSNMVG
jgi:hypothetical protein